MKTFALFFGYYIKKPAVIITALFLFIVSVLAPMYKSISKELPCAVYVEEGSEASENIISFLEGYDFIVCGSEDEVRNMVSKGTADCGVIIFDKAGEEPSGCVAFITSERSSKAEVYKIITAMAILKEQMPEITFDTSTGFISEESRELLYECYEKVYGDVIPLSFEISSLSGAEPQQQAETDLPPGIIAICGFAALAFTAFGKARENIKMLSKRIRGRKLFLCAAAQVYSAALIFFIASAAGMIAGMSAAGSFDVRMILSFALYFAAAALILTALSFIPISGNALICASAIDSAAALFVCPIFISIGVYARFLLPLRAVCVPYLIYLIQKLLYMI